MQKLTRRDALLCVLTYREHLWSSIRVVTPMGLTRNLDE